MKTPTGIAACAIALTTVVLGTAPADRAQPRGNPDVQAQRILSEFKQEHGFVPKPLRLMSERAGVLPQFMAYGRGVLEGGPLTDKERSLVALAAAVALRSPECTLAHRQRAKQSGATDDEIIQATLIAGLISNTSALHVAYGSVGAAER